MTAYLTVATVYFKNVPISLFCHVIRSCPGQAINPMNSNISQPVQRLYQLNLYGRWFLVVSAWLILAPWSLWRLRGDLGLLQDHFTWVAIRYGLAFLLVPAFCLFFCIGLTGSVLVWHSQHLCWGISPREQLRWENQVKKIQSLDPRHPLWRWVFGPDIL